MIDHVVSMSHQILYLGALVALQNRSSQVLMQAACAEQCDGDVRTICCCRFSFAKSRLKIAWLEEILSAIDQWFWSHQARNPLALLTELQAVRF